MNNKGNVALIVILALIPILVILLGAYFFFGLDKTKIFEDTPLSSFRKREPHPQGQNSLIKADTTKQGPWNMDLHIMVSNDGDTFRDDQVFEEKAGVPTVIHDSQGKLIAAFQWFPENNEQNFDKIAIKTSDDAGETWTAPTPAKFINYPDYLSRPFDPTLVLTKENKIRMYFTVNYDPVGPDATTGFHSAISDDGINYTYEDGERFKLNNVKLIDCAVVALGHVYFLTAPDTKGTGAYYAMSTDGLNFIQLPNIQSEDTYNWTGNLLGYGEGMRFYGNSKMQGKIFYSYSKDGGVWEEPVFTDASGGDPAVVQALESKYVLIYVGASANQGPPVNNPTGIPQQPLPPLN